MLVETSWYDNRGSEDFANLDLDRFPIPLEDARKLDRIRAIMSEKAGREIRVEELVRAALEQFLDANSALLSKPVSAPPALPVAEDWLARKSREIFLGMMPG